MLFAALFACAKKHTDGGGLRSLGELNVNGPQFDGSVHEGTKVLYTLKGIHENQNYTLRTEIALRPDGSSTKPDGTLTVDIYPTADAFRNDPGSPLKSALALPAPNSNIYEVNFDAPSASEYVVVLSGKSDSVPGIQFFYNLRLMSADPTVLSSFTTATIPASAEQLVNPLNPGYLNIYSGGTITPSGSYNITLVSNATATQVNPQIFVYLDSSLTVSSLMLSSIPTATGGFVITTFNAGDVVTTTELITNVNTNVISNVTFTNQADDGNGVGGPFIVLKGVVSAVTYTLLISQ